MTRPADAVEETGTRPRPYRAYLIRCWLDGAVWRFSLESIDASRLRQGFARLQEVTIYIEADLAKEARNPA